MLTIKGQLRLGHTVMRDDTWHCTSPTVPVIRARPSAPDLRDPATLGCLLALDSSRVAALKGLVDDIESLARQSEQVRAQIQAKETALARLQSELLAKRRRMDGLIAVLESAPRRGLERTRRLRGLAPPAAGRSRRQRSRRAQSRRGRA